MVNIIPIKINKDKQNMTNQTQSVMKVEDYIVEMGPEKLIGKSFVDCDGEVYTVRKIAYSPPSLYGVPRLRAVIFCPIEQGEYEHNLSILRHDREATPKEVQADQDRGQLTKGAKKCSLVQKVLSYICGP